MKVVDMHCDTIGEILKDHQNGGNTVSYTHLDVYKRQKLM